MGLLFYKAAYFNQPLSFITAKVTDVSARVESIFVWSPTTALRRQDSDDVLFSTYPTF